MNSRLYQRVQDILKAKRRRAAWMRVVSCLAAFIVFITSVELTSPAETTTIENSPVIEENYAVEESYIGEENNGEPVADFDVSVTLPEYVTGRDFHLYHLHDGLVQEINALTIDGTQPDEYGRQTAFGFAFNTDSFSTFVLSYTVDFHWNIDGQEYEYCLDGGDSVSLCELLEALRVTGEDTDSYRFIRDIAGVWFSDESLVKAVPITEGITAGALKEKFGLECEYSAEMTAAEREAADSRVFYAPDWALVSLRPFDTDEYLTVEMKGGECFRIYVTDGQIRRDYISASGDTYTITVTYGEEAGIPDGSDLQVYEILPEDERFAEYYAQALEASGKEEGSFVRRFDITIMNGDEAVEPAGEVSVNIELADAPSGDGVEASVVHFAEEGIEVIEPEQSDAEGFRCQVTPFSV